MMDDLNYTMLCDFYELTMGNGYFKTGLHKKICYFDVFFRKVPDGGGFAIAAGLDQIIDYIQNLRFDKRDIEYLRSKNCFDEQFLRWLKYFRFTGDIWAVPEGTPVFPGEPVITVRAPAVEAQLVETFLLLQFNHQSLIATKANRVVRAAQGRPVLEFGSRRAQGGDAAILGARATYIGGCAGTACTITDQLYGVPAGGTMAHTLLVDTYNTLKSGVPNAIRCFKEFLVPKGITNFAIRLDSGDISYLSKQARKMLDDAGLQCCKITASNALDEELIQDLIMQGACVDTFGVGERMITARSEPVFGAVYKLAAVEDAEGTILPKIKISENTAKITTPHFKKVYRLYDRATGKALADQICVWDETIDDTQPLTIFDQDAVWKTKKLENFRAQELQVPIFKDGKLVYKRPTLKEIRDYCASQVDLLWDEVKRFHNPHTYYVDLSEKLWLVKRELLRITSEAKSD